MKFYYQFLFWSLKWHLSSPITYPAVSATKENISRFGAFWIPKTVLAGNGLASHLSKLQYCKEIPRHHAGRSSKFSKADGWVTRQVKNRLHCPVPSQWLRIQHLAGSPLWVAFNKAWYLAHYLHQWLGRRDTLHLYLDCGWYPWEMTETNWCIKWQGCLLPGSQTEEWRDTNLLLFSEDKCKVLHPEWDITLYIKRNQGPIVWMASQQKELGDPDGQAEHEAAMHPLSNKLLP